MGVTITKKGSGVVKPVTASNKLFPEGWAGAYAFETQDGPPVLVGQPVIDWVTVIGAVPNHVIGQQDEKGAAELRYKKYFKEAVSQKEAGLRSAGKGGFAKGYPKKDEAWAALKVGPRKTRANIRLLPDHDDEGLIAGYRLRVEWNPRKAGLNGLADIRACLEQTALMGADFGVWLASAEVTRLDIAVDLLDVERCDIFSQAPEETKVQTFARRTTGIETVNHHKSKSTKRRAALTVYDKRQERLDQNETPKFGPRPHIRIERSLAFKNNKPTVASLLSQPNRLEDFRVRLLRDGSTDFDRDTQRLTAASLVYLGTKRTLQGSLGLTASALSKADPAFWRADLLWEHWPTAVKKAGLAPVP